MKNTFRRFQITTLVLALLLSGCGAVPSDQGIADPFPREPLTLTIWSSIDDYAGFDEGFKTYRERHPNVSFNHQFIPSDQFDRRVIEALASNQGPDLITIPNDTISKYRDKLVSMPDNFFDGANLVSSLSSQYAPAVVTDAVVNGKVYGIPFYTDSLALYVNTGLLNSLLVQFLEEGRDINQELLTRAPVDWSEVVEITKLVTKLDAVGGVERAGIALGTSQNVPFMNDIFVAILLQMGIDMTSADRTAAAFHLPDKNDPNLYPAAKVLNFLKGFVDPTSDYYSWSPLAPGAVESFLNQKTAMIINYRSLSGYLRQRNPSLRFATAPLPQRTNAKTIVDYARYRLEVVTNNSRYPEVAWDFLRHMIRFGLNHYRQTTGQPFPIRQQPPSLTTAERIGRNDPFDLQLATARSWYKGKDPVLADLILSQVVDEVSLKGTDTKQAINNAATALTRLLNSS